MTMMTDEWWVGSACLLMLSEKSVCYNDIHCFIKSSWGSPLTSVKCQGLF